MYLVVWLVFLVHNLPGQANQDFVYKLNLNKIVKWSNEFGKNINYLTNTIGCTNQIENNFKQPDVSVKKRKTEITLKKIIEDIDDLFSKKRKILKKIVKDSEQYAKQFSSNQFYKENQTESATKESNENQVNSEHNFKSSSILSLDQDKDQNKNDVLNEVLNENSILNNDILNEEQILKNQLNSFLQNEEQFINIQEQQYLDKLNISDNEIENLLNQFNKTNSTNDLIDVEEDDDLNNTQRIKLDNQPEDNLIQNNQTRINLDAKENEYFFFKDMKKIYSPSKPLNNLSIPRQKISLEEDENQEKFNFRWNSWTPIETLKSNQFPNYRLNFTYSGVHVPLNIYPQHTHIKNQIKWSENLDHTFKENRKFDPNLNFQFFCSISGFLRLYPLVQWRIPKLFEMGNEFKNYDDVEQYLDNLDKERENLNLKVKREEINNSSLDENEDNLLDLDFDNLENISDNDLDDNDPSRALDLYDCRMRDWFIKAAAAPKDVLVMLDSSGSMRGERSKIAQNVILNALETLTENDYVSVIKFNKQIVQIDECFENRFIQASKRNVAKLKDEILELSDDHHIEKAQFVANYTDNIQEGIRMLKNTTRSGSNCSKILMLVTDGDVDNLEQINSFNSEKNIRIFTYLVGREVIEGKNSEALACKNFGYFTHLKDLAEVKEEVQLYVPVLSKTIGLHPNDATVVYSSVYADPILLSLSNMIWFMYENKQFQERYEMSQNIDNNRLKRSFATRLHKKRDSEVSDQDPSSTQYYEKMKANLMITLSMPVFNTTNGIKSSWELLGVAGVDVPINEILKEVPFYRLGVGGYVFIVNNNGFLIYHPDMRSVYKGFLKRFYTSLDIMEVELVDDERSYKEDNPDLLKLRESMINEETNCSLIKSKIHYDSQRRVFARETHFCWISIPETLFTFAVAIPNSYGHYYVNAALKKVEPNVDYKPLFNVQSNLNSMWFVHPHWNYCWDNLYKSNINNIQSKQKLLLEINSENKILHFLNYNLNSTKSFEWKIYGNSDAIINNDQIEFICNENLIKSLLFDVNATRVDPFKCLNQAFQNKQNLLDVRNIFISTRTGFTRFFYFSTERHAKDDYQFRRNSIDEIVYKKAVEYAVQYNDEHFVFQTEAIFNNKPIKQSLITATKAMFLGNYKRYKKVKTNNLNKAPYLVVGMQFTYESLSELFFVHPSQCNQTNCEINCLIGEINCFLIDDNGYIVLNSNPNAEAGKLISEIDHEVYIDLIRNNIYREIEMYDFQGICERESSEQDNFSSSSISKINLFKFLFTNISIILQKLFFYMFGYLTILNQHIHALQDESEEEPEFTGLPNRTIVDACLKMYTLLELNSTNAHKLQSKAERFEFKRENDEQDFYIIHKIPYTNLVLLITNSIYAPNLIKNEPRVEIGSGNFCNYSERNRRNPYMYEDHMCFPNQMESEIQQCGSESSSSQINSYFRLFILMFVLYLIKFMLNMC